MNTIVQWATILSPIIAVVIAWWASKKSVKDTDRKIKALEENTAKQIESVKSLSRQMIEATIKQVELQIHNNLTRAKQAKQEWEGIQEINNSGVAHFVEWKEGAMNRFQENKPERDYNIYCGVIKELEELKKTLVKKAERFNC